MNARVGAIVMTTVLLSIGASACGSDSTSSDTLPAMITTTSTTTIPPTTTTLVTLYEVKSGDSLSAIAEKFDIDQAALMMLNGITDPDHIEAGQVLKLPPPTVPATAPPTGGSSVPPTT